MLAPDVPILQVDESKKLPAGGTEVNFMGSPTSKGECQYDIVWLSAQYLSLFFSCYQSVD